MYQYCPVCSHPNVALIDRDLAAGRSISDVSWKHFGNYAMWHAVRRHKRRHVSHLETKSKSGGARVNDNEIAMEEQR